MNWTSFNPLYNRRLDGRPSNVASSIKVGISRVVARATLKLCLAFAVAFFAIPTRATSARGIASANQTKRYAVSNGAMFDKLSKLVEAPTAVLCPLRLPEPYPFAYTRKVFEFYLASGALSRFNEGLSNLVVGIASKTRLFTRHFLEPSFGAASPAHLQTRAVRLKLSALLFYLSATKRFTFRGGSNVFNPEVYSERTVRFLWRCIFKPALEVDIPFALCTSNKLPALNGLRGAEQMPLIVTDSQRHLQATINGREAKHLVFERKDALVVVNRSGFEAARALALTLTYASNRSDCKVRTQSVPLTNIRVAELLQRELGKVVLCPRYLQYVVTCRCKCIHRAAQAFGLTRSGLNLAAHATEGHKT